MGPLLLMLSRFWSSLGGLLIMDKTGSGRCSHLDQVQFFTAPAAT